MKMFEGINIATVTGVVWFHAFSWQMRQIIIMFYIIPTNDHNLRIDIPEPKTKDHMVQTFAKWLECTSVRWNTSKKSTLIAKNQEASTGTFF